MAVYLSFSECIVRVLKYNTRRERPRTPYVGIKPGAEAGEYHSAMIPRFKERLRRSVLGLPLGGNDTPGPTARSTVRRSLRWSRPRNVVKRVHGKCKVGLRRALGLDLGLGSPRDKVHAVSHV